MVGWPAWVEARRGATTTLFWAWPAENTMGYFSRRSTEEKVNMWKVKRSESWEGEKVSSLWTRVTVTSTSPDLQKPGQEREILGIKQFCVGLNLVYIGKEGTAGILQGRRRPNIWFESLGLWILLPRVFCSSGMGQVRLMARQYRE